MKKTIIALGILALFTASPAIAKVVTPDIVDAKVTRVSMERNPDGGQLTVVVYGVWIDENGDNAGGHDISVPWANVPADKKALSFFDFCKWAAMKYKELSINELNTNPWGE